MLLLHTDVFLTTREIVLQRAFRKLRAGPGPPQIAAAGLLHRDPFTRWPSLPGGLWDKVAGVERIGGIGRRGKEKGRWGRGRSTNLRLSASPASVRTSR